MTSSDGRLPDGLTQREFLEDLLDALGDHDAFDLPDGTVVTKAAILQKLADGMDSPS